jgi:hypothetical protein
VASNLDRDPLGFIPPCGADLRKFLLLLNKHVIAGDLPTPEERSAVIRELAASAVDREPFRAQAYGYAVDSAGCRHCAHG